MRRTVDAERREMSTRQSERLRRRAAAAGQETRGPSFLQDSATKKHRPVASSHTSAHESGTRNVRQPTSHAHSKSSATAKSKHAAGASAAASAAATTSSTGASKAAPLQGRFNRLVVERGFFFTVYLYVLGESITLGLVYLLHTHQLGVGDVGSWLAALHVPAERYLNVGPTVYGLQLSPRLVLNYLVANVCTYPLLPLQMRFCLATAPILQTPFTVLAKAVRRREPAVPKAPAAKP